MTAIDRLQHATRLGEAYLVLHKLDQLADGNAFEARQNLIQSIKDAEEIILKKQKIEQIAEELNEL